MDTVGYHGTSEDSAQSILSSQNMYPSNGLDEWLGRGYYFFVDLDDAKWWCTQRKYDVPAIIIGTFKFSNKVIDLVASSRDQYLFFEYCKNVKYKTDRLTNGKRRSNYMQLAITKLLEDAKYRGVKIDAIRASFDENRKFWFSNTTDLRKFPCKIQQVQICVFNFDVIQSLERYKEAIV